MCSRSFLAPLAALVCGMTTLPALAQDVTAGASRPPESASPWLGGSPAGWSPARKASPGARDAGVTDAAAAPGAAAGVGRNWSTTTEPYQPPRDTYTGHILLVDAAWIALAMPVADADADQGLAVAGGGYLLGGPLVHLAHRRPKTALASLVTRVGFPLVGALVGAGIGQWSASRRCPRPSACNPAQDDFTVPVWAALGGVVGGVAAPIVDAAVLARVDWFDKPSNPQSAFAGPASRATMLHFGGAF